MTDKSIYLRSFNTHFVEFITDILLLFPDNQDIKSGLVSFEMLKRLNPALVIKTWYSKVFIPYQDMITEGNISFFFEKNYASDLDTNHNSGEIMLIIDNLKKSVTAMNDVSRQQTMKYVQNLSELSKIYNNYS
jgi:hypothetical protein